MVEQGRKISPEEEIRELERKLEEKKREFAEREREVPPEKEMFREVLREHIEAVRPAPPPSAAPPPSVAPVSPPPRDQAGLQAQAKRQDEREAEIRSLIELALTRTIEDAVRLAERESPYLLDELHDHLVDDFYEKLIQLRKVKPF